MESRVMAPLQPRSHFGVRVAVRDFLQSRGRGRSIARSTLRSARPILAVAVCPLLVLPLAGCAALSGPPNSETGDRIAIAIESEADGESSRVNFTNAVAGDWTRMIIICGGSRRDANESLGFEWTSLPDPTDPDFLSLAIFATDDEVIEYFEAGKDDGWVDHWAFTFCSVPGDPGYDGVREAQVRVGREQATVQFARSQASDVAYWYVPSAELLRLAELQ